MKVSVALAAYNGEKYIAEQLHSILVQLRSDDEVIVSDDNPGGETERIVREMAASDKRIHYFEGPGQGVIKNFEYAISKTTGDIIFLSDQDDVWMPDKVHAITREIKDGAVLVLHNAEVTDESLNITEESFFNHPHEKSGKRKVPAYLNSVFIIILQRQRILSLSFVFLPVRLSPCCL